LGFNASFIQGNPDISDACILETREDKGELEDDPDEVE